MKDQKFLICFSNTFECGEIFFITQSIFLSPHCLLNWSIPKTPESHDLKDKLFNYNTKTTIDNRFSYFLPNDAIIQEKDKYNIIFKRADNDMGNSFGINLFLFFIITNVVTNSTKYFYPNFFFADSKWKIQVLHFIVLATMETLNVQIRWESCLSFGKSQRS